MQGCSGKKGVVYDFFFQYCDSVQLTDTDYWLNFDAYQHCSGDPIFTTEIQTCASCAMGVATAQQGFWVGVVSCGMLRTGCAAEAVSAVGVRQNTHTHTHL